MAATIRAEQHQALTQMRQDIERRLLMLHAATSASTPPLGAMLQDQTGAMGNAGQDQPLVSPEPPGDQ